MLEKIKEASTPDRFTQDFLSTTMGYSSGSAKAFVPLAKRIGLLESDEKPTELYKKFRNPSESKIAMAEAIKIGYPELYTRNENAHELDSKGLTGLLVQNTGLAKDNKTLKTIRTTFETLKLFADFQQQRIEKPEDKNEEEKTNDEQYFGKQKITKLGLTYNINLVLPKTDDVAIFNAIFKSLKENLLK